MKKINWIKVVSRRHCLFRLDLLDRGTATQVRKLWGVKHDDQLFISSKRINAWYCNKTKMLKFGNVILSRAQKEPNFINQIAKNTEAVCLKLARETKKIATGNLKLLNNKQIIKKLNKYIQLHNEFAGYFDVSNSIENLVTRRVKREIRKILIKRKKENKLNDYLKQLFYPERQSLTNKEQVELNKVAIKVKKEKINYFKFLEKHTKNYQWLSVYNPDEEPLNFKYFEVRLKKILQAKPQIILEEQKEKVDEILDELKINKKLTRLIELIRKYIFLHTFREEMLSKSYYLLQPLLIEIANRWRTDLATICALTPGEIIEVLDRNRLPDLSKTNKRKKAYLHLMKNGEVKIYSGKAAKDMFLEEIGTNKLTEPVKQIKGTTASPGYTKGFVRVILNKKTLNKIKKGEILVTPMSSPDYVWAIEKAGAIVTDQGGLLCHAAVISREMKKPCIVGTEIATSALKTGDLVEVDANRGIIKLLV